MTSTLLQPGATMVDGVGLTSLPDHSVVAQAGYMAESLYIGGQYGTNRTAIERAWSAGLCVMPNYERSPSAAKGGYPAGERAAKEAISDARKLGFEGDSPLVVSGADEHFSDLAGAGLDYHRAIVDVFTPIGWVGGAYGFREMLELLSRQDWWPDTWPLWHWGGDGKTLYPWAWAKQGPGGSYFNSTINRQVDHNVLLKPMRFWSGYGPDHLNPDDRIDPVPLPEVYDMGMYVISYGVAADVVNGGVYEIIGGARRHVTAEEWTQVVKGVSMDAGGNVPAHNPWQPVAFVTNPPFLAGLPVYVPAGAGEKGDKGDPGPSPKSASFVY